MHNSKNSVGFKVKALALAITAAAGLGSTSNAQVLEEILVTAERRVESIQDTPISITAMSGEDIDNLGITNTQDMFTSVPGMGGFASPGARGLVSISIRGVSGGNPANISLDPAVGMYMDGVYVGKMLGSSMDVAQIERIEVLRGPQGTLYGRNSTAGAVNIISRKPLGEFEVETALSVGNYGYSLAKANIDFNAIGDVGQGAGRLSSAFSVMKKDRDGYYKNYSGGADFDSLDRLALRAAFRWDINENITVDYVYDHSELDEISTIQKVVGFTMGPGFGGNRLDFLKNTALPAAQGLSQAPGADPRISNRWIPSIEKTIDAYERVLARGEGRPKGGWAENAPVSDNTLDGHAVTAEWNLGEKGSLGDITLKSISSVRETEVYVSGDLDDIDSSLDSNGVGAYNDGLHGVLLQFYGGSGGASFPGVDALWGFIDQLGAGHSDQDTNSDYEQFSQEFQLIGEKEQLDYALGLFWFEDESSYGRRAGFALPLAGRNAEKYQLETEALAIYGQGTYRVPSTNDRLALTLGVRYTEEKKSIDYDFGSVATPFGTSPARKASNDNKFDNFSYNLTAAYDISGDMNAFVRYATGYRSGGFNGEVFNNGFDEETMEQLEAGVKSDFLDNRVRVNASLFTYEYDDLQNSSLDNTGGTITSSTVNAGKAERWGGEVEVSAAVTANLIASLAYSYISGDFEEYPDTCANGTCIDGSKKAKRSNSPSNKVNASIDYTFAHTSIGKFGLFVHANWQDDWEPISLQANIVKDAQGQDTPFLYTNSNMDERTVVSAKLSLTEIPVSSGELAVSLWGNNLTDDDYPSYGINFQGLGLIAEQYGDPRTYGVELQYKF